MCSTTRRSAAISPSDVDALAILNELGLVLLRGPAYEFNVSQAPGAGVSALARGDFKRAAAYARPKQPAA